MKVVIILLNTEVFSKLENWEMCINKNLIKFTYPWIQKENNWYMHGFVPQNDFSMDLRDYHSMEFDIELEENRIYEVCVSIGLLQFVNIDPKNEHINTANWKATVIGKGRQHV